MNYDEMDGDRLKLPANRNCYRLLRVSWALLKFLVFLYYANGCSYRLRPPKTAAGLTLNSLAASYSYLYGNRMNNRQAIYPVVGYISSALK